MSLQQPSLEALTERAIAASQTGDLEALRDALEQRAQALGEERDPEKLLAAFEGGEIALAALRATKQRLQAEHSRWEQMRGGFAHSSPMAHPAIDLQG